MRDREKQRECDRAWYYRHHDRVKLAKAAAMRKARKVSREKMTRDSRARVALMRARLLEMYGRTCALCGFADVRALTLDHIAGNGSAERRQLGERGVYRRALSRRRPDEYRTLCMNCQFIAARVGRVRSLASIAPPDEPSPYRQESFLSAPGGA